METQKELVWDDIADVTPDYPNFDCGAYQWALEMQDGSPIDDTVFTYNSLDNPRKLTVYTEDELKIGTYNFIIKLSLPDYPDYPGS